MASSIEISKSLDDLNKEGGIPGLSYDEVVKNIIDKQVKSVESKIKEVSDSEEQADAESKEMKKQLEEYYDSPHVKTMINAEINNIKSSFKMATNTIKQLPISISSIVSSALLPSVIAVPAAVPNVPQIAISTKEKVNTISSILNTISVIFSGMLSSSLKIQFEIPDSILAMIGVLAIIKNKLDALPV
jgi:hypothetical protein